MNCMFAHVTYFDTYLTTFTWYVDLHVCPCDLLWYLSANLYLICWPTCLPMWPTLSFICQPLLDMMTYMFAHVTYFDTYLTTFIYSLLYQLMTFTWWLTFIRWCKFNTMAYFFLMTYFRPLVLFQIGKMKITCWPTVYQITYFDNDVLILPYDLLVRVTYLPNLFFTTWPTFNPRTSKQVKINNLFDLFWPLSFSL